MRIMMTKMMIKDVPMITMVTMTQVTNKDLLTY